MADRPLNVLSLCTGGMGLDLGVELAVSSARVVCGVEWEAGACAYLAWAMREGCVDRFPVWSDLRTFDGGAWRGVVDLVTAGYPCQPFSLAGKRKGADDPRHLWPHVARVVRECGAPAVFLENVPGHLGLGFDEVARELQGMGYRVAAGLFSAEEVGAPHRRERLFCLALADGAGGGFGVDGGASGRGGHADERYGALDEPEHSGSGMREQGEQVGAGLGRRGPSDAGGELADSGCERRQQDARGAPCDEGEDGRGAQDDHLAQRDDAGMADTGRERPQGHGEARPAARAARRGGGAEVADAERGDGDGGIGVPRQRAERGAVAGGAGGAPLFPPGPADADAWGRILAVRPELAPAIESRVRVLAHGLARRDALRLAGNGVCPLAAAHAFRTLSFELTSA